MSRLILQRALFTLARPQVLPRSSLSLLTSFRRTYASKKDNKTSGSSLIPGSQQKFTMEADTQEYEKAEEKMKTSVEWYRKECSAVEARSSGRVTPSLLDSVRVRLSAGNHAVKLDEVATVGVRDGTTLLITLHDESSMKAVETALYESKLPNVIPQRKDDRTVMIPIPKPTIETRQALYKTSHLQAEDIRVQVRKIQQASVKKGKYGKHSFQLEEFQKLQDKWIGEINKILENLKKVTGGTSKK